jgi:folate-binding protein YgfZ
MIITAMPSTHVPAGACRLPHWGVIQALGEEAAGFLHGQLSNDVSHLTAERGRLAAYCSPQGRMLATFLTQRPQPDRIWLACRADVLPPVLKRLSMFVLRAKARLSDASGELVLLGLAGAPVAAALGEAAAAGPWASLPHGEGRLLRLPDAEGQPRWLWTGPEAAAQALLDALPALDVAHWDWLEVRSGVASVVAATSGQFVPQMLNLEVVGGVDFRKGCYPGQEVVARSQYLGKLKRRGQAFSTDADASAGTEVFWSGDPGQPAGLVALAAPGPDGRTALLAEMKLQALDEGSLHLGAPDGPVLRRESLPYALPAEKPPAGRP